MSFLHALFSTAWIFVLVSSTEVSAYSTIKNDPNGSFHGLCDDRSVAFSGLPIGDEFLATGSGRTGMVTLRGPDQYALIREVCSLQAGNDGDHFTLQAGTMLVFDREKAFELAGDSAIFSLNYDRLQEFGDDSDMVLTPTQERHPIVNRLQGRVMKILELRDGAGEFFYAIDP